MRLRGLFLPFLLASLAACGGALAEGRSQFDRGDYPEAKQTFAASEVDSRSWGDAKRARARSIQVSRSRGSKCRRTQSFPRVT